MPYTVRRGDTLWSIGQHVGASVAELARWNDLADPDVIETGTVLRVPPHESRPAEAPRRRRAEAPAEAPPPAPPADPAPEDAPADPEAETPEAGDEPHPTPTAPQTARRPDPDRAAPEPERDAAERGERAERDATQALARARTDLQQAEAHFWAADYAAAREAAEQVHGTLAGVATDEARATRARAALWSGMALAALGRDDEAVARFRAALDDDPGVEIPGPPPPRLERLFEAARETQAGG